MSCLWITEVEKKIPIIEMNSNNTTNISLPRLKMGKKWEWKKKREREREREREKETKKEGRKEAKAQEKIQLTKVWK